ncbi:GNAT family N-acetyltransferase [Agrobacterium tumefaciens]|uniref:GNAT family N-acetyltransferase n=1 Tax=Agrobacterium tumefaciens TaxID=358 RepID=UPI0021D15D0C|nr:GNAT family N-acetyltransferase [Agrobacterium tumefaciens]UXT49814.1 GNAT family N-acetyltransferase [Agrobacterium tumefaciens]
MNTSIELAPLQVDRVKNDPVKIETFVKLFNDFATTELIGNLKTRTEVLTVAGHSFPLTLNAAGDAQICYICCPSSAYIDYAIDETRNFLSKPLFRSAVRALIKACAPLVRASGLDHQVQVNNWLYSTNPVPLVNRETAAAIRNVLVSRYPDRAIVLRSLNEIADPVSIAGLRAEGFRMLASRQIYIAAALRDKRMPKHMRNDRRHLRRTSYQLVNDHEFMAADYPRCQELYDMLYLEKYTPLNPHYTARYIGEMHQRGILKMAGFRDASGILVGITGLFENGATLTQPIVGYDTTLPIQNGLYRMVMAIAQDYASERGLFFNMSAGAADFKRRRGAVPTIEYSAVYVAHLPLVRRIVVRIMETMLTRVGIPLLRRFKL